MKIQKILLAITPLLMVVGCDKNDNAAVDVDNNRTVVMRETAVTNTDRMVVTTDTNNSRVDINVDARPGQPVDEAAGARVEKQTTINVNPPSVSRTDNSISVTAPTVEKTETFVVNEAGLTRVNELVRAESSASGVQASVADGKFVLKGTVRNEKEKQDLGAKVSAVVGADKVDNQIQVKSE